MPRMPAADSLSPIGSDSGRRRSAGPSSRSSAAPPTPPPPPTLPLPPGGRRPARRPLSLLVALGLAAVLYGLAAVATGLRQLPLSSARFLGTVIASTRTTPSPSPPPPVVVVVDLVRGQQRIENITTPPIAIPAAVEKRDGTPPPGEADAPGPLPVKAVDAVDAPKPQQTTPTTDDTTRRPTTMPPGTRSDRKQKTPSGPAAMTRMGMTMAGPMDAETRRECHAYRDHGLIPILRAQTRTFCRRPPPSSSSHGPSTFTYYSSAKGGLAGTRFQGLTVDLRRAQVAKPIRSIAEDGKAHDPRFTYASVPIRCHCAEHEDETLPQVWRDLFAAYPRRLPRACGRITGTQLDELLSGGGEFSSTTPPRLRGDPDEPTTNGTHPAYAVERVRHRAILVGRRDDHNPFFQIAGTLNAWIMLKVLDWAPSTTQLIYLDDGLPTPIDALQAALLSPTHAVVRAGAAWVGRVVHFDDALVAPFELQGPMMRHLNDHEPCGENALIADFRAAALTALDVSGDKPDVASCIVTVITRRPYQGRMVQRKWLNEDEILEMMQEEYGRPGVYKYGTCSFQSVDFVTLSLAEQMRVVVESDVIIGMHGAGMVNVLWTRPETLVIEIFPRKRKRWGYRNLCQFVRCRWHEFRGGQDVGNGDNRSDKVIADDDWFEFFDPLFREAIERLKAQVEAADDARRRR